MISENQLSMKDMIQPLFIIDGKNKREKIDSMEGIERKTIDLQLKDIENLVSLGLRSVIIFPSIDERKKTKKANEALNPKGLIPKAIKEIKKNFPELVLITDIALDPYNSDGHDGILKDGKILNDKTVEILVKQAVLHAKCGADFVAPSDMMDGRVYEIRKKLDDEKFNYVGIISYSAKYASSLYGPFRDALNSTPKTGDKKSYQINPANCNEAIKEVLDDEIEGADMVMIKPAIFYLDIITKVKSETYLPVVAYQVSGEYSMIKNASKNKILDLDSAIIESLLSIKRSGADLIISYFTQYIAQKKIINP
jgi:porphobilinogen synthase|tara:strand:- start:164000 stop:164929 length:930 start_codon:yes stop_codon:yes gene_type:complete